MSRQHPQGVAKELPRHRYCPNLESTSLTPAAGWQPLDLVLERKKIAGLLRGQIKGLLFHRRGLKEKFRSLSLRD